ncbi:hypothetical protein PROSTU_02217 [Providencia stuartii ATCC 25827]|uniref:Uncharacterized protein n=1 Tax=Providencia stuartii ATCC 25827 TaxID=471874 RepID=A0AA86YW85_PROST|nr:hypothetical protein PROSTU_02217 [Providencia stuartii ATCC 25827]
MKYTIICLYLTMRILVKYFKHYINNLFIRRKITIFNRIKIKTFSLFIFIAKF